MATRRSSCSGSPRLKLPTYAHEARALADISRGLRDLGTLTGQATEAARRADAFDRAVAALRARHAGQRRLRVFYQVWPQPLITLNGEHLISQALDVCGADNVFAAQRLLTPTVTEEAVLLADPDAIVTGWIPAYGGTPPLRGLAAPERAARGAHRPVAVGESRLAAPPVRPRGARRAGVV